MLESAPVINLCPEAIGIVGEIIDRDDVYWTLSSMAKKMSTCVFYSPLLNTLHLYLVTPQVVKFHFIYKW